MAIAHVAVLFFKLYIRYVSFLKLNYMPAKVIAEQEIHVGTPMAIEGASPAPPFVAVFEDDGDTGYFYALDILRADNPVLDALHIYNVKAVKDRNLSSLVQIVWSNDNQKAALLINKHPHAVFDFKAHRGYCRTGFPTPIKGSWTQHGHDWDDKAMEFFR